MRKPTVFDEESKPLNDSTVVGYSIGTHSVKNHIEVTWWFANGCQNLPEDCYRQTDNNLWTIDYGVSIKIKTYASSSGERSPSPSTSNNRYALSFAWQFPTVSRANNRTWTLCGTTLCLKTALDANVRAVLWKKLFILLKFSFVRRIWEKKEMKLTWSWVRQRLAWRQTAYMTLAFSQHSSQNPRLLSFLII